MCMKPEKDIWVNGILKSVENIQRAKVSVGFYQKVIGRIRDYETVSSGYVLRVAAALALLVALNVFACVTFSDYKTETGSMHLQAFAKEYNITSGTDNF